MKIALDLFFFVVFLTKQMGIQMEENLVIVESPAKARTIGNFLGKGFRVESSFGHIRDLSKDNYGIDIKNNYLPDLKSIPSDVLEKAKVLVINYPNNPTGTYVSKNEVELFLDGLVRRKAGDLLGRTVEGGDPPLVVDLPHMQRDSTGKLDGARRQQIFITNIMPANLTCI